MMKIILDWVLHSTLRTVSVAVISTLLIGLPFIILKASYNKGFKAGYSQALSEHPQNVYQAPATIYQGKTAKFFGLKIYRLGLGFIYE